MTSPCLTLLSQPPLNPRKPWVPRNLQRDVLYQPSVTAKLWDVAQISLTEPCGLLWGFTVLDKVTVRSALPSFVSQFFSFCFFSLLCRHPCLVLFCFAVKSNLACGWHLLQLTLRSMHFLLCLGELKLYIFSCVYLAVVAHEFHI